MDRVTQLRALSGDHWIVKRFVVILMRIKCPDHARVFWELACQDKRKHAS